jgi:hypothetical protein
VVEPVGVRRREIVEVLPRFQGMPGDGPDDSVLRSLPHTPPRIRKGKMRPGVGKQLGFNRLLGTLEIWKQPGVSLHEILQSILRVMMPAGGVDMENHGDAFRLFKSHGPQDVLSLVHPKHLVDLECTVKPVIGEISMYRKPYFEEFLVYGPYDPNARYTELP